MKWDKVELRADCSNCCQAVQIEFHLHNTCNRLYRADELKLANTLTHLRWPCMQSQQQSKDKCSNPEVAALAIIV